jgi:hypothetical protein
MNSKSKLGPDAGSLINTGPDGPRFKRMSDKLQLVARLLEELFEALATN